MHIEQSARDGCIVLTLTGDLDVAAAPLVQRALLRCLAKQPDAVICDLSGAAAIDPVCTTVFSAVAHRPRSRWPHSNILLCAARPAVAAVLLRQGMPRLPPICDTLDQAVAQAHSRPPFLRERLRLVPTLDAIATARWFVADVCQRWQLDALTETAQPLAGELVVAVQSGDPPPASADAEEDPDDNPRPGSGLDMIQRTTPAWGVRRQTDGSRVVWGILRRSRAQCA
jgi:anti-anti-sigma factor